MGKISNSSKYPIKEVPSEGDTVIGTDEQTGKTVQFNINVTSGGEGTQSTKQEFISIPSQVQFILSSTPNNVDVWVNEKYVTNYTLVSNTVTLGSSPLAGSQVIIRKY